MNLQKIDVTVRFDQQGKLIPIHFTWKGKRFDVASIGRQWQAEDGYHILVMDPRNYSFHLIFQPKPPQWFLLESGETFLYPYV